MPPLDLDQRGDRIHISRVGALNRNRVEEAVHRAVADLARRSGFESVDLASLTWREQIELFARTSEVLAIHGGGWPTSSSAVA